MQKETEQQPVDHRAMLRDLIQQQAHLLPMQKALRQIASGLESHAEGERTIASAEAAHAEGFETTASANEAHAEGLQTKANGFQAHAEGFRSIASGNRAHAEGTDTIASGIDSHAEGDQTIASGCQSHTEGFKTIASAFASHAEGFDTIASGFEAHAEGEKTVASAQAAHAEGFGTVASNNEAHAEGVFTIASGLQSHAEGAFTEAIGDRSHAEGDRTIAEGNNSHAQGSLTRAGGDYSHAEGLATSTEGFQGAHIMGKFGDACEDFGWFMAGGTDPDNKAITACIKNNGDAFFNSINLVNPCCADYAEMFETEDGGYIDFGYFVTFTDGSDKIRKANSDDDYILGVTSATPAILAGATDYYWHNKYMRDKWGQIKYQEIIIPEEKDEEGNIIVPERKERQPMLNPNWNCEEYYVPRSQRPEWVAVGLLGQILVRDDGACKPGGYCIPNNDGVATDSYGGYRVLRRTDVDQILILFRA